MDALAAEMASLNESKFKTKIAKLRAKLAVVISEAQEMDLELQTCKLIERIIYKNKNIF